MKFVTPKQVAARLQVHLATVHRWIVSGKLKAYRRMGSRYLINEEDIDTLIVPINNNNNYIDGVIGTEKEAEYRSAMKALGAIPKEIQ
jgi:excisionase family DNA binding protein